MVDKSKKLRKIVFISSVVLIVALICLALFEYRLSLWREANLSLPVENANIQALVAEIQMMDYVHRVERVTMNRMGRININIFVETLFAEEQRLVILNLAEKYLYGDTSLGGEVWFRIRNREGGMRESFHFPHLPGMDNE